MTVNTHALLLEGLFGRLARASHKDAEYRKDIVQILTQVLSNGPSVVS